MIRVEGDRLELVPAERAKAPALSLPLVSLHVCACRALVKAYAKTEGLIRGLDAYDPEGRFQKGAVPGGLVVLRRSHGERHSPCADCVTAFGGTGEVVRLLVDALWKRAHLRDPLPSLPAQVAPSFLAALPGVRSIEDIYQRRPAIYLVDPSLAAMQFVGSPDYAAYTRWQAGARNTIERLLARLQVVPTPEVEVRTVLRPPRRRPDRPSAPAAAAPALAPLIALTPRPQPSPVEPTPAPRYAVQLSLF